MGKKITMFSTESSSIQERFEQYLSAASAKGLSSKTLKTYRQHFHCISKHLDITVPLSSLSRAQVDAAIVSLYPEATANNSEREKIIKYLIEQCVLSLTSTIQ